MDPEKYAGQVDSEVRELLNDIEKDSAEISKVIRLVDFLTRLALLHTKITRDVNEYENVLWIKDIPKQKGCYTQAWGRDEDFDPDIWIEIQTKREPELPNLPPLCKDWIEEASLQNKSDIPNLLPEITRQVENPAWKTESDQPEFISQSDHLDDHPEVYLAWDEYVEDYWWPWVREHNEWESIHKIYAKLFAFHQEQLRLGEEYELVLAIGLLTWQTPSGQRVKRHLIVANAVLEFEARLGKFTVQSLPDGASVRPELDMLDIDDQPARAEEMAISSLVNTGDDPWEKNCIDGVLQALVHSISAHGEYNSALESKGVQASNKPIIEFAPALILRKRSTRGLTETLKRIKIMIEKGGYIPSEFRDIAEIRSGSNRDLENDPGKVNSSFNGEVFFPKPSNEEQKRIVKKIQMANGVLVQGPPGTGKSHTIANLICHLLATGQRVLITAKTPRALQVLERLVPDELRPLCINLLGSGLEEKRSLESSVAGILRKNGEWNEERATRQRKELELNLTKLREEKAQIDRRLRSIRESEIQNNIVAEGAYRGTAARIAEAVNQDKNSYDWFKDKVPLNQKCPISEKYLGDLQKALIWLKPEKRRELSLILPDELPPLDRVTKLFEQEKVAVERENRLSEEADKQTTNQLSRIDTGNIKTILDSLCLFENEYRQISGSPQTWMRDALQDVVSENVAIWRELHRVTEDTVTSIEPLVDVVDESSIEYPNEINIKALFDDVTKLKKHMENGGKLGRGPFRPKQVKDYVYILNTIRVNGRPCSNFNQLAILFNALRVRIELDKVWGFWVGRYDKPQGPFTLQIQILKEACNNLNNVLSLRDSIGQCRKVLQLCPNLAEPIWADELQVKRLISSCELALAQSESRVVVDEIHSIEASLTAIVTKHNANPITGELLFAFHNRNIELFSRASNKIKDLKRDRTFIPAVDDNTKKLREIVPMLTDELELTYDDPSWESRIQQIQKVWCWAQAKFWVEEYIRKEDIPSLDKRARQIENEINITTATLASLYAWSFCFSRLKESHRRHMEAWQQSMRRLGKGTGKHASRHRREAQLHLNECREAVPAWVMPLHRVWDTVDPAPGIFDIIIVDEASQCGVEALPLFYLGKKILIVGDDKQISPDAVGVPRDAVNRLMEQYLYDFGFKSSFDIESSLFDHGRLRYGTQRITLREHFRCMPEIIRFSNDLCYSDTPLIPLRQYGPDRLNPLEHVFISNGYREGNNNRVVNEPEANAIVEKITELCDDSRYNNKTMGVIVLQGEAQAGLIEGKLLERLGAVEMEQRRLICGNPYSFQGDERDIVFLSMVAAPNERIGPFTKAADERRFNVAASRARDQMYLFHSVTSEDLSPLCLRRRLLEFFENTKPLEIAGISQEELERRASYDNRSVVKPPKPFDSWFEIDVALELLRKGFNVLPQYEIASKRIDLVVESSEARLAVECDGDNWHGADQYEADMQRQRQLERCGWEFSRIRESAFYSNKERALQGLWRALEERGILPVTRKGYQESEIKEDEKDNEVDDKDKEIALSSPSADEEEPQQLPIKLSDNIDSHPVTHAEDVTMEEIQNAILLALSKCSNQSCTISSMTSRVLKELEIRTRGNPFEKFERRVKHCLDILEDQKLIEKYKAKNRRVRLLPK